MRTTTSAPSAGTPQPGDMVQSAHHSGGQHHRMLFKNTRSLLGASNRRVALPSKRCCTGRIGRRSRQPRHRESRRLLQARGAASLSRALRAGARYCACVATMMVSTGACWLATPKP